MSVSQSAAFYLSSLFPFLLHEHVICAVMDVFFARLFFTFPLPLVAVPRWGNQPAALSDGPPAIPIAALDSRSSTPPPKKPVQSPTSFSLLPPLQHIKLSFITWGGDILESRLRRRPWPASCTFRGVGGGRCVAAFAAAASVVALS